LALWQCAPRFKHDEHADLFIEQDDLLRDFQVLGLDLLELRPELCVLELEGPVVPSDPFDLPVLLPDRVL